MATIGFSALAGDDFPCDVEARHGPGANTLPARWLDDWNMIDPAFGVSLSHGVGRYAALDATAGTVADFPAVIDLTALDGTNGFRMLGLKPGDFCGGSVSSAGDVNGDGIDDFIVSAPGADRRGIEDRGECYVVFGALGGFPATFDVASLDGTNGFRILGVEQDDYCGVVSSAGDVNGDGFDDLVIGVRYSGDPNAIEGRSYVVFGKEGGHGGSLDLGTLDGTNGFRLDGFDYRDFSGSSVSGAGDINGDGYDDIIIGAFRADHGNEQEAGEAYVVFGKADGFAPRLNLGKLDGTDGFRINGVDAYDYCGLSVSSAGDVNGDGFDDIVVGAPQAGGGSPLSDNYGGRSYVIFGKPDGYAPKFDPRTLDGTNGFRLDGDGEDFSGGSVSAAGDVNGDGFDDLIIGGPRANPDRLRHAGSSYVVFGKADGFSARVDLVRLDGTDGFRLDGLTAAEGSGSAVSSAGDVNADGFADVIIGTTSGKCYVVFGKADGFSASLDLATLDGTNGFTIENDPRNGDSIAVSSAGDVNADGFDDILIGAERARKGYAGESYVVYGHAPTEAVTRVGSAADQLIRGGVFDDTLHGEDGNDRLGGGGGADLLDGGTGKDWAYYDTAVAGVRASLNQPGVNTGEAAGDSYVSIENLFGSRFDDRLAGDAHGNRIRGEDGTDTLSGRGGDDSLIGGGGHDRLEGGTGADSFVLASLNAADSDKISDFVGGVDKVALDDKIFGFAEGSLPAGSFAIGTTAQDADDRVIYDATSGQLFFDADGTGASAQVLIATLTGAPMLTASDVVVV